MDRLERLIEVLAMMVGEMREERHDRRNHYVTKEDLNAAKAEIIQALGTRVEPAKVKELTAELKASGENLKQAVEAAK